MNTKRIAMVPAAVLLAAVALYSVFACATGAQAAHYIVTDLGQMDESVSPADINNYGQVTGNYFIPSPDPSETSVFLWTPNSPNSSVGSRIDLGSMGNCGCLSFINDCGQVAISSGSEGQPPRLWTPAVPNGTTGTSIDLEPLFGSTGHFFPFGINNFGQLIVPYQLQSGAIVELWSPTTPRGSSGSFVDIEPLDGFANVSAYGINARGQVVGGLDVQFAPSVEGAAFLWSPTTPNGDSGTMINLGTLEGHTAAYAYAVNDSGQVTGGSYNGQLGQAFLWSPTTPNGSEGTMIDLGPGEAYDINAHGHVVGHGDGPFLYTSQTGTVDLGALVDMPAGWRLTGVQAINDFGQIVGIGEFIEHNANYRAFLLTPVDLLPGDYNQNGIVDAADYTVWRDNFGSGTSLPNDDTPGVGPDDYDRWRAHFGQTAAGGAGTVLVTDTPAVVPEPASAALLLVGFTMFAIAKLRDPTTRSK